MGLSPFIYLFILLTSNAFKTPQMEIKLFFTTHAASCMIKKNPPGCWTDNINIPESSLFSPVVRQCFVSSYPPKKKKYPGTSLSIAELIPR